MKPGDKVVFHMIPIHLCGGGSGDAATDDVKALRAARGLKESPKAGECRCLDEATARLPATVVTVHEREKGQPQALELDVEMPDEVLALGYAPRQACVYRATTIPPESGTWTVSS